MQTYHDRKAHLVITVDRTHQTGHTAASQKQRLNNPAEFQRIQVSWGMMHVLYSSKDSTRNGEKGNIISLSYY